MRTISYTSQFKKDYRRTKAGRLGSALAPLLQEVVDQLAEDIVLAPATVITRWLANGEISAIAICGPTSS